MAEETHAAQGGEKMAREGGLIPLSALKRAWLSWEMFPQICYNWERMMGQNVAYMFSKVVNYFYEDDPEQRKDVMRRESEFYNCHVEFGACIMGMAVAMEEQKALGKPVPGDLITSLKTSLMGPLAGVGDTIWQAVVIPILLAICIDITNIGGGNIWGSVLYTVLISVSALVIGYKNFMFGYHAGGEAILDFLEKGVISKLIKGASIMGCMVMGGLIVNYVSVTCGITITSSAASFNLQTDFLDLIIPNILPLGVVMLVYGLLKKQWSSIKILVLLIVIGVVGGLTGILAV